MFGLFLILKKRKKILEILSEGIVIITYELIIGMESFFLAPEKDFWEKTELFSELKIMNTRLAFDTQILLPNLDHKTELEINPLNKDFNYKFVYNLKLDGKKAEKERVITRILKLDENNQYGHGMTKPLPKGCIKDDKDISWTTFNLLLEKMNFEDKIGSLLTLFLILKMQPKKS